MLCIVFNSFLVRQFYAHCLRSDSLFYQLFCSLFLSFRLSLFVVVLSHVIRSFPDYGCLSGGRGGETGSDVLAVLVPGRDFCGVS